MIFNIGYSDDMGSTNIIENAELRGQTRIFQDRKHAGQALAQMLKGYRDSSATVFAIPAYPVPSRWSIRGHGSHNIRGGIGVVEPEDLPPTRIEATLGVALPPVIRINIEIQAIGRSKKPPISRLGRITGWEEHLHIVQDLGHQIEPILTSTPSDDPAQNLKTRWIYWSKVTALNRDEILPTKDIL